MSRIGEYQAALRKLAEEHERQSVCDFATELGKPPDALLAQLNEAGIVKTSASDAISSAEKSQLLKWFQDQHRASKPRKKITVTHDPLEHRLIRAVAEKSNGAEYEALEYLLGAVFSGEKLAPPMQQLINILVAKCLLLGALPLRRLGRPKDKNLDSIGLAAAERYWSLVDSGATYQEAVEKVSSEIHKSERHVMRLIAKHKAEVGETLERRTMNRKFWNLQTQLYKDSPSAREALYQYARIFESQIPVPDLNEDDYLEHLDELIDQLAVNAKPLTRKI